MAAEQGPEKQRCLGSSDDFIDFTNELSPRDRHTTLAQVSPTMPLDVCLQIVALNDGPGGERSYRRAMCAYDSGCEEAPDGYDLICELPIPMSKHVVQDDEPRGSYENKLI